MIRSYGNAYYYIKMLLDNCLYFAQQELMKFYILFFTSQPISNLELN